MIALAEPDATELEGLSCFLADKAMTDIGATTVSSHKRQREMGHLICRSLVAKRVAFNHRLETLHVSEENCQVRRGKTCFLVPC